MTKRDDIINAAIQEFGECSYEAASINRIIKSSGTSKGTFYHYFKDKKELYFTIIEDTIKIKQAYFSRMLEDIQHESGDFFDLMKAQAKAGTKFMLDNPAMYQFGVQFAKDQSTVKDEFQTKYLPDISTSYAMVVEAGLVGYQLSEKFPIAFVTRIVSYTMMHYYDILFDRGESPSPQRIEQQLDLLLTFLKNGIS